MKIKLDESYLDTLRTQFGEVEIFKNPTRREVTECGKHCRGIIDLDGNLYVLNILNEKPDFTILHANIFEILSAQRILKGKDKNYYRFKDSKILGLNVQQKDSSKDFWLGENVFVKNKKLNNTEEIEKILKKAAKKSKDLKFHPDTLFASYMYEDTSETFNEFYKDTEKE